MNLTFTASARQLGLVSAAAVVALGLAYAAALACGLLSLELARQPITGPVFTLLELLIVALGPPMVALMMAVRAWAPPAAEPLGRAAPLFMVVAAILTCSLHIAILSLGAAAPAALSFRWPSLAYALDILAWDLLFPIAMLCAAPLFGGSRLARAVRFLLLASGALALAGLAGPLTGDMRLRAIGIIGYAVIFPAAAALLFLLFRRTAPAGPR